MTVASALKLIERERREYCSQAKELRETMAYSEVARDMRNYGIERHTLSRPGEEPFRRWFEYEGDPLSKLFRRLVREAEQPWKSS